MISGAEVLCDEYCESGDESVYDIEHQRHDRRCGADRRQRILTKLLTHDYSICQRVRLLECKSQQHRERKAYYQPDRAAFC